MNMFSLIGDKIALHPLQPSHLPALLEAAADGQLWTLPYTVVPNHDTGHSYLERALQGQAQGTVIPFVTTLKDSGQVIGSTRFWKVDYTNRKLEIGHTWLAATWQGSFANAEAKYLMLRHAFESLRCVRVQFQTDVLNQRSRAAILRLGATEEGVIRHERIMPDGRKRDSVRFSIIDDEWQAVRSLLEDRLKRMGINPTVSIVTP